MTDATMVNTLTLSILDMIRGEATAAKDATGAEAKRALGRIEGMADKVLKITLPQPEVAES